MVRAMIDIPEEANHILNIVKAKHNLKDKSEAITKVIIEYGEDILEPELRPEFIEKLKLISKERTIKFKDLEDFKKRYNL
ncbi:DUF2683 family protein [Candidatus Pacearchaeota archaeon]|nr:DUF2683 family protein [Candidatus Pacearchaeota archaeon]